MIVNVNQCRQALTKMYLQLFIDCIQHARTGISNIFTQTLTQSLCVTLSLITIISLTRLYMKLIFFNEQLLRLLIPQLLQSRKGLAVGGKLL